MRLRARMHIHTRIHGEVSEKKKDLKEHSI